MSCSTLGDSYASSASSWLEDCFEDCLKDLFGDYYGDYFSLVIDYYDFVASLFFEVRVIVFS